MLKIFRIVCVILSCIVCGTHSVNALPEVQNVESGSATFDQSNPSTLTITADDRAVINFLTFNIGQNEVVNFIQPSASASVLSRVTGNMASTIAGGLFANGLLFLINPCGINFTPTANVQVNSLVASTLDISTNNFLNGNYFFERMLDKGFAQILNEGNIQAENNIGLIGSAVKNTGVIQARAGSVQFASGDKATLSFDSRGLFNVEINAQTSGSVTDINGVSVNDAVANSGTIEGAQVYLTAQAAENIFEYAVNQQGLIRATRVVEENGVIKLIANRDIQVSGTLEAEAGATAAGQIEVHSDESVYVNGALLTKGDTTLSAHNDININADLTTDSGNLALIADEDLDGLGSIIQKAGTTIATVNFGDISIYSSGATNIGNINAAGNLNLRRAGQDAVYQQAADAHVVTGGSFLIDTGVTLNAANSLYEIGQDWLRQGIFNAEFSTVSLVSDKTAQVTGSNTFYNFSITIPAKLVKFASEETQTIMGTLTLRGAYGSLLRLESIDPPTQWKILPQGAVDIAYVLVGDCINIRGPPLLADHSDSLGNLVNWMFRLIIQENELAQFSPTFGDGFKAMEYEILSSLPLEPSGVIQKEVSLIAGKLVVRYLLRDGIVMETIYEPSNNISLGEEIIPIKQTIVFHNPNASTPTIEVTLRSYSDAQEVIWNSATYAVTEEKQYFAAYEKTASMEEYAHDIGLEDLSGWLNVEC